MTFEENIRAQTWKAVKPYKCTAEQLAHLGPELCDEIERSWAKRHRRDRIKFFKLYLPELIVIFIGAFLVLIGVILAVLAGALIA